MGHEISSSSIHTPGSSTDIVCDNVLISNLRSDLSRSVQQSKVSYPAQENPVGVEYIIMEKLPGIELAIVQTIATYQISWTSIFFKKYGSLYYVRDLDTNLDNEALYTDADGITIKDSGFSIGPSTGRELIDDKRATMEFDRGPCPSPNLYSLD
ncbi:hypothetical protein BJ875DRAFT_437303 [Amylocarpus encephaloides]|uniref:Uncharacterized protein n=1 Tax=Amylocarpus encephaloides TaxID=45428 RepID=A0A9P8C9Q0_9HELO|nr:hypothetical protein BJ875DRAFT_437303 [Amylocarpus encephaloides]